MASAVLATFTADDVKRFGERRTQELMRAIEPALSIWAGETVFIERTDEGEYLVMGSPRQCSQTALREG